MPTTPPRPRRRFGQNFLVDPCAVERIVEALALRPGEVVVEIGPGRGVLTRAMLEREALVTAVEIDRDLAAELERELVPRGLDLRVEDALGLPWNDLPSITAHGTPARIALVGNLPYNISKPIAMRMIDARNTVSRAVFMFQREVADRLTATPGGREYGPLTVLAGRTFSIERVFELAPGSFRPRPRVRSTVTRWIPRDDLPSITENRALKRCLRACFARRRRTLLNNVRVALGCDERHATALLAGVGLDPGARPETIAPGGFTRLAAVWPEDKPATGG